MQKNTITDLVAVVQSSGLEAQTANYIQEKFLPFFEQAKEWNDKAQELVVTDVSQKEKMKMARDARLTLRQVRISADKVRKSLKEDIIKYGKTVDGVYNIIESVVSPIEKHLEAQEKFEEIYNQKVKAELREARMAVLSPYIQFVPYGIDFATITEEDFEKIVSGAKLQKEHAEKESLIKANEEAEAAAKRAEEQKRLANERAEQQKQLEKERKERELLEQQLEAERKAKREADEKAEAELKAKRAAARKLAAAPDKEKILMYAQQVLSTMPKVKTAEAVDLLTKFQASILNLKSKAESL